MSISNAKKLLAEAKLEKRRLERHLLVGAAIDEALQATAVIVGGTAEEFWTQGEYGETDLDICVSVNEGENKVLESLGFSRSSGQRHWFHRGARVAIEFPASFPDADPGRFRNERVGSGMAVIIGLDDLYLDRLRQATLKSHESSAEFQSAWAVVSSRYEDVDWPYVDKRVAAVSESEPIVGDEMKRIDSLLRRRARRKLAEP